MLQQQDYGLVALGIEDTEDTGDVEDVVDKNKHIRDDLFRDIKLID